MYFKKIEDEVQGSDDEMVIDSDFYSGYEEYNNNEDETFPEHINFENKLLNLGKIVLEKKNVEGNFKSKKKSRRVRCGNCSHCLLNKETPRYYYQYDRSKLKQDKLSDLKKEIPPIKSYLW